MRRHSSVVVGALLGTAVTAGLAAAQQNRTIAGDWEVVTTSSGCKAILANELELAWGPHPDARFAWSGQCGQNGLITGQGKLTTTFTSQEGATFRIEKTGLARDGMFEGMTSEATYSNADDWNDATPAGSMQLHDFGDVRNPMPSFYRDGCTYFVSGGTPDMSRAQFDCQASAGAALRNQLLAPAPRAMASAAGVPAASPAPASRPPPAATAPAVGPRGALLDLLGAGRSPAGAPAPADPEPDDDAGSGAEPEADDTPVSDCIEPQNASQSGTIYGRFVNTCGFPVYFTMCNESPKKDSFAESFSCVNSKGKMDGHLDGIGANGFTATHVSSTGNIYWFACRKPLTPKEVEYKPGDGIYARCG